MKLSVSAWCVQSLLYKKKMSLYEFIDICSKHDADGVELLDCFIENDKEMLKIVEYVKQRNLKISSYSIGNDFVIDDSSEREKQIEYVLKGIDTACRIGTGIVRIFSGDVKGGMSFDTSRQWILDSMRTVSAYAEKKGITLAVENHGLLAGKSSQIKFLTDEVKSKSLRATTDTGNFLLVNEDPLDAVKKLRDVIGFVHFKDFKEVSRDKPYYKSIDGRTFKGVVLGTGDVPLKQIVDYFYETSYQGYLSIEYEGHEDPIQGTIDSIEFVKSIIK